MHLFLSPLMHIYASYQPYSSHSALYFKNECLQLKWKEVREVEPKCFNQKKRKKNGLLQWLSVTILTVWNWAFSHLNSGSLTCCLTFIGNDTRLLLPSIRHQGKETQPFFFLLQDFLEKRNTLNSTELIILSKEVRRIGAAAENRTYITMDYLSGCFLSPPLLSPLYFKMDVYHYLPIPVVWLGSCPFLRAAAIRAQLSIKHSNVQAAHSAVCVITVTITDKMTGR